MNLVLTGYRLGEMSEGFGEATGGPKVRVPTLILVFSGPGGCILKPFDVLNGEIGRFFWCIILIGSWSG